MAQQRKNGKWQARWVNRTGKQDTKDGFRTKKEAVAYEEEKRREVRLGLCGPGNATATVADAVKLWLDRGERLHIAGDLEWSTLRHYHTRAETHIIPLIGGVKLRDLTTPAVERFCDELIVWMATRCRLERRRRPYAREVLEALKTILDEAVRLGLVAVNHAAPVKIPGKRDEKLWNEIGVNIPTRAEVQLILNAVDDWYRPFIVTAAFTGMRMSELRGLIWENVDFERGVIHVRQRSDCRQVIGAPKSRAGRRAIPMAPIVANSLRELKVASPETGPTNLVFTSKRCCAIWGSHFHEWVWVPALERAGLVDASGRHRYTPHGLRHFFASWVIEEFSAKKAQTLLGHASIQMTYDRYAALFPDDEDDQKRFAAAELRVLGAPRSA
jgi:integrase